MVVGLISKNLRWANDSVNIRLFSNTKEVKLSGQLILISLLLWMTTRCLCLFDSYYPHFGQNVVPNS